MEGTHKKSVLPTNRCAGLRASGFLTSVKIRTSPKLLSQSLFNGMFPQGCAENVGLQCREMDAAGGRRPLHVTWPPSKDRPQLCNAGCTFLSKARIRASWRQEQKKTKDRPYPMKNGGIRARPVVSSSSVCCRWHLCCATSKCFPQRPLPGLSPCSL